MQAKLQETEESGCEACFGIAQRVKIKSMRFWQRIAAPPTCKRQAGLSQRLPQTRQKLPKAEQKFLHQRHS